MIRPGRRPSPTSAARRIFRSLLEKSRADAKSTAAQFEAAAKRSQLSVQALTPEATSSGAAEAIANLARTYDLAVLKQSSSRDDVTAQEVIEAVLFNSGRPVLIVPYIQKAGFSVKRVSDLLGWQPRLRPRRGRQPAADRQGG